MKKHKELLYRLSGEKITIETNISAWTKWYQSSSEERVVDTTDRGTRTLVTFFTGRDARSKNPGLYGRFKSPVLWVTQVFRNGEKENEIHFPGSREVAEAFHKEYSESYPEGT